MLILVLSLVSVQAIGTVTCTAPISTTQTNDDSVTFRATAVQSGAQNITNMTFWVGSTPYTNGTLNGSADGGTTLTFQLPIDISGLSEGSNNVICEARNQTVTTLAQANSVNSSTVSFIVDRTEPTCRMYIDVSKIRPQKPITLDCGTERGTTDANTLNTSSFSLSVTDSVDVVTTQSPTTGIYEFSRGLIWAYSKNCFNLL